MFGTDLYSPPLGRRISHLVPQIIESSLTDDEKAQISAATRAELFKVPRPIPEPSDARVRGLGSRSEAWPSARR